MEDIVIIKPWREQFQNYVHLKWSMCKFSIKSYKKLVEFWDQLAQILSNFAEKAPS